MTDPVATLSMYDWPEVRPSIDRLWQGISKKLIQAGIPAPEALKRIEHPSTLWKNPDLVVGQTCGWPYANYLRGTAIPFARFDYGCEGCPPGHYNSVFIGRTGEDARYLENAESLQSANKIAMNGDDSQSGFHVFREIAECDLSVAIPKSKRFVTGAHRESIKAVAQGKANIAAIDAVAFALASRHDAEFVENVTVIGHSIPKPGLPLITSPQNRSEVTLLFNAVHSAVEELPNQDRDALFIRDVIPATDDEYEVFLS